jgi:aspartyl/asparaginyl-tRNA synthetase
VLHASFGLGFERTLAYVLGFERTLAYVTGLANVRDARAQSLLKRPAVPSISQVP